MNTKFFPNSLRSWMKKRRLRKYGLRKATEADVDFILADVIDGAIHGHYSFPIDDAAYHQKFRGMLKFIIHNSMMSRMSDRGVEQVNAELWVYGSEHDDQVGYLLVTEKLPGSGERELEMLQAGVRSERRGEGHGRKLVHLFVALTPPGSTLYARCKPASEAMFTLLKEKGFSHFNTMPRGTRELELRAEAKSHVTR